MRKYSKESERKRDDEVAYSKMWFLHNENCCNSVTMCDKVFIEKDFSRGTMSTYHKNHE